MGHHKSRQAEFRFHGGVFCLSCLAVWLFRCSVARLLVARCSLLVARCSLLGCLVVSPVWCCAFDCETQRLCWWASFALSRLDYGAEDTSGWVLGRLLKPSLPLPSPSSPPRLPTTPLSSMPSVSHSNSNSSPYLIHLFIVA